MRRVDDHEVDELVCNPRELARRLLVLESEQASRARATASPAYTNQDGERPPGFVGDGTKDGNRAARQRLLAFWRAHRDELHPSTCGKVVSVDKARHDALVGRLAEGRRTRRAVAAVAAPTTADELRARLGLVPRGAAA